MDASVFLLFRHATHHPNPPAFTVHYFSLQQFFLCLLQNAVLEYKGHNETQYFSNNFEVFADFTVVDPMFGTETYTQVLLCTRV